MGPFVVVMTLWMLSVLIVGCLGVRYMMQQCDAIEENRVARQQALLDEAADVEAGRANFVCHDPTVLGAEQHLAYEAFLDECVSVLNLESKEKVEPQPVFRLILKVAQRQRTMPEPLTIAQMVHNAMGRFLVLNAFTPDGMLTRESLRAVCRTLISETAIVEAQAQGWEGAATFEEVIAAVQAALTDEAAAAAAPAVKRSPPAVAVVVPAASQRPPLEGASEAATARTQTVLAEAGDDLATAAHGGGAPAAAGVELEILSIAGERLCCVMVEEGTLGRELVAAVVEAIGTPRLEFKLLHNTTIIGDGQLVASVLGDEQRALTLVKRTTYEGFVETWLGMLNPEDKEQIEPQPMIRGMIRGMMRHEPPPFPPGTTLALLAHQFEGKLLELDVLNSDGMFTRESLEQFCRTIVDSASMFTEEIRAALEEEEGPGSG